MYKIKLKCRNCGKAQVRLLPLRSIFQEPEQTVDVEPGDKQFVLDGTKLTAWYPMDYGRYDSVISGSCIRLPYSKQETKYVTEGIFKKRKVKKTISFVEYKTVYCKSCDLPALIRSLT